MYNALVDHAAQVLNNTEGAGLVLLSGGNSPQRFLPRLFEKVRNHDLIWTLSDERCVPIDHEASNYAMIDLLDHAPTDRLVPLHNPHGCHHMPDWDNFPAYPMALLGFADDGHTLSLFPGSASLEAATDPQSDILYFENLRKKGEDFTRISFGFAMLAKFDRIILIVSDEIKSAFLKKALASEQKNLPVVQLVEVFHAKIRFFTPHGEIKF